MLEVCKSCLCQCTISPPNLFTQWSESVKRVGWAVVTGVSHSVRADDAVKASMSPWQNKGATQQQG